MDLTETVCGSLGRGGNPNFGRIPPEVLHAAQVAGHTQGGNFVGIRLRCFLLPAAPELAREHGHAGGRLPRLVPTLFSCEDGREA